MGAEQQDDVLEGTKAIAHALGFRGDYYYLRRRIVRLVKVYGLPAFKLADTGDWKAQREDLLAWWKRTRVQLAEKARRTLLEHDEAA